MLKPRKIFFNFQGFFRMPQTLWIDPHVNSERENEEMNSKKFRVLCPMSNLAKSGPVPIIPTIGKSSLYVRAYVLNDSRIYNKFLTENGNDYPIPIFCIHSIHPVFEFSELWTGKKSCNCWWRQRHFFPEYDSLM